MSHSQLNKRISLTVETISPVAIGDGGRLSPLTDYIWIDEMDSIMLIDHKVFEQSLSEDDSLMDKFVRGVYDVHNKNKQYFLRDFIEKELDAEIDDFKKGDYVLVDEWNSPKEINTILKEGGAPYLPGTSLKGAIKTALLYNWMLQAEDRKIAPAQLLKNIVSQKNRNKEKVQSGYDQIENILFGDLKLEERMDFSLFKVRDTNPFLKSSSSIFCTERYHIRPGEKQKSNVPIITEAIKQGSFADFDILIAHNGVENIQHSYLQFLGNDNPVASLFSLLNQFVLAYIKQEQKVISNLADGVKEDLNEYLKFLNLVKTEIENGNNETGYLRLGKGKTYFNNSIGLTISNEKLIFEDLRWMFSPLMGKKGQKLFPITRQLTLPDYLPLGWVKLSEQKSQ